MKAIIIARVSTEEQREAGNSLPAQEARLQNYCKNKNFEIVRLCSFDESAYKNQRDAFDRIVDFILEQKEKVIVCFDKVDRLSRNVFDKRISLLYEKALSDEIEIHFVSDGQILSSKISATEKFTFSMSLGLAKYYSDAISDNVKRAQEQKLRKGEWLGKAPFGYKNIKLENEKTAIIVDEHNRFIVKTAFELYATGGYSMELLCKKIKTDFGISWFKSHLAKILQNPFYHGTMIVKGKSYPHCYTPIVSQSLFQQVQNIKDGFKKKPFKYAGLPFFYRGLIRCYECGLSISPERHKGHVYYHCTQYNGKHGAKWIREDEITKQLGEFFKALQMPDNIRKEIAETLQELHLNKMEFHNNQFDKFTGELKTITNIMDKLYIDKLKDKISDEQYDKFHASFTAQKEDINLRLSQLNDAEDNYYNTTKHVLEITKHAFNLFESSELEERRQLITLVLQNIRLQDENIVYDVQKPFDAIKKATDGNVWLGRKDSNLRSQDQNLLPYRLATPQKKIIKFIIYYSSSDTGCAPPRSITFLYSCTTCSSIMLRVSGFRGCTTSRNVPSLRLRDGIETNSPLIPSITLRSRIINALSKTIVAYAFNFSPSVTGNTLTSVISIAVILKDKYRFLLLYRSYFNV